LEDQHRDANDPGILNAEMESIFNEEFLARLGGCPPFVRLESESFVDPIGCDALIFVPQECTSLTKSVPT
jgi:hypothetical protein